MRSAGISVQKLDVFVFALYSRRKLWRKAAGTTNSNR
jgi:hypothetical protein